jgi:hypothetical protein
VEGSSIGSTYDTISAFSKKDPAKTISKLPAPAKVQSENLFNKMLLLE